MTNEKTWTPAVVVKRHGASPVYDIRVGDRVVKKHADVMKTRVVPVINLPRQKMTEEEKNRLLQRLEEQELPTRPTPEAVASSQNLPSQSSEQRSIPDVVTADNGELPSGEIRRSERLRSMPKVNYKC